MAMDSTSQLRDLVENARALLAQGGTLESSSGSGPIADDDLTKAVAKTLGAAAPPETPTRSPSTTDDVELAAAAAIGRAHSTLSRIQNGGSLSNLSEDDVSALELIVHTIGRPALCYRNGRVETPLNKLDDNSRWYVLVTTQREEINRVSSCVGRLACEHGSSSPVLGTGWRVAKDLILTNRHVARSFATDCNSAPETWTLDVAKSPFIDFAYTDGTPTPARFAVTELVYCAPNGDIDLRSCAPPRGTPRFPRRSSSNGIRQHSAVRWSSVTGHRRYSREARSMPLGIPTGYGRATRRGLSSAMRTAASAGRRAL